MAKEKTDKKLNNLLGYKDFSKELVAKPKTTKRTEVAKDVINESHITNTDEQKDYVCKVVNSDLNEDCVKKVYECVEGCLSEMGIKEDDV
jgi:hypothetical protein